MSRIGIFIIVFLSLINYSCTNNHYNIKCLLPNDINTIDRTFYTYKYCDSLNSYIPVDSAIAIDNKLEFSGIFKESEIRIISVDGALVYFILEDGYINIDLNTLTVKGTPLNDKLNDFNRASDSINATFAERYDDIRNAAKLSSDDKVEQLSIINNEYIRQVVSYTMQIVKQNNNNPLGQYSFNVGIAYNQFMTPNEYLKLLSEAGNYIANYGPTKRQTQRFEAITRTQSGCKYTDVLNLLTTDSTFVRLSNLINNKKYTLFEIWTYNRESFEMFQHIKQIAQNNSEKVEIVSIATGLEYQAALKQINNRNAQWKNIIDTKSEIINTYGIGFVPFIMLVSPDSTIIARNISGENIKYWLEN